MESRLRLSVRLLILLLLCGTATIVSAQTTSHADHAGCGTLEGTRFDLEESIRKTAARYPGEVEKRKGRIAIGSSQDYIQRDFWVRSFADGISRPVTASLIYEGRLVRIWVDNVDTASIPRATIDAMARALDTATPSGSRNQNKGIVENNQDVFGAPPTEFALDGGTDFLVTDIITGAVNYVGFFSPSDQMRTTQNPYSNEMNLLYIDSRELQGNLQSLLGIIAHEHQHLIHYGQNRGSRSFYNEGCSELAAIINGYRFRGNYGFMANTNVDLIRWAGGDDPFLVNADYERAMTFHLYLYEQLGERFITELVKASDVGMGRINIALENAGYFLSQTNWTTLIRTFSVANWVRHHPDSRLGYRFSPPPDQPPTSERIFEGPIAGESGTINLQRAASAYHLYVAPGALSITVNGTREFRVMAMVYRGSEVEVSEHDEGEFLLGRWGPPADRIVLAFVNLSEDANVITWNTNSLTLGGVEHTLPPLPSSLDLR